MTTERSKLQNWIEEAIMWKDGEAWKAMTVISSPALTRRRSKTLSSSQDKVLEVIIRVIRPLFLSGNRWTKIMLEWLQQWLMRLERTVEFISLWARRGIPCNLVPTKFSLLRKPKRAISSSREFWEWKRKSLPSRDKSLTTISRDGQILSFLRLKLKSA